MSGEAPVTDLRLPPYTLNALRVFEAQVGFAVPADLRQHLLTVGRELVRPQAFAIPEDDRELGAVHGYPILQTNNIRYTVGFATMRTPPELKQYGPRYCGTVHIRNGQSLRSMEMAEAVTRRVFAGDESVRAAVASEYEGVALIVIATRLEWKQAVRAWLWGTGQEATAPPEAFRVRVDGYSPIERRVKGLSQFATWAVSARQGYTHDFDKNHEDFDPRRQADHDKVYGFVSDTLQRHPKLRYAVPVISNTYDLTDPVVVEHLQDIHIDEDKDADETESVAVRVKTWMVQSRGYGMGIEYIIECSSHPELEHWYFSSMYQPNCAEIGFLVPDFTTAMLIETEVLESYHACTSV